jgi:ribokinase
MSLPACILSIGYLSIDWIQNSEGSFGPIPGGAALYAALGARAVGMPAGICAAIGQDYPSAWRRALVTSRIDITNVSTRSGPTRTTRLYYDPKGNRHSPHFRDPEWEERTQHLAPPIPDDLQRFGVLTIGPAPIETLRALAARAAAGNHKLIVDTSVAFVCRAPEALLALLSGVTLFVPSLEETRLLIPGANDDTAAVALAARGTDVLQKRGREGGFLVRRGEASGIEIPAPSTGRVVDPTGAGDSMVGALAAMLARGADVLEASRAAMRVGALTVSDIGPKALGFLFGQPNKIGMRTA